MSENRFEINDILSFPETVFPLLVFSDNARSFLAWGIRAHEKGLYSHFMFMHRCQMLASQKLTFKEEPIEKYLGCHRLKFYHNPNWTEQQKYTIISTIKRDLKKPWYKRVYDPLGFVGQALNLEWLQIPGIDICSDGGRYLRLVDEKYDLKYPSPTDLHNYLKRRKCYKVFGRYEP